MYLIGLPSATRRLRSAPLTSIRGPSTISVLDGASRDTSSSCSRSGSAPGLRIPTIVAISTTRSGRCQRDSSDSTSVPTIR